MSRTCVYLLSCPDEPWWDTSDHAGDLIQQLQDSSTEVSFQTFRRHCVGVEQWLEEIAGVDLDRGWVRLVSESYTMAFKKGVYDGMPCYFIDWSRIEWIWVDVAVLAERGIQPPVPPWKKTAEERRVWPLWRF